MDDHIVCPQCGHKIPVAQAIYHQIQEQHRQDTDKHIAAEKLRAIQETEVKMKQEFQKDLELKLKDSSNDAEEAKEQNRQLRAQLLELTKTLRGLKQREEMRDLEMEKKLVEERDKIQKEVSTIEKERSFLENKALQKQLDDTKKSLEEARRKAEQTSQQLQGEVLELDLEDQLRSHFAKDEIVPIKKGIEGGDILQKVNGGNRQYGSILWETKRTKNWVKGWLPKLREDMRQIGASTCVLISQILPPEITSFGMIDRVWVTSQKYAVPLAYVLRGALIKIAEAKLSVANKDEKLEMVHQYISSEKFKQQFESAAEGIIGLKTSLQAETRAMKNIWKKRDVEIERLLDSLIHIYGEFQGILGPTLSPIKHFELPTGEDDSEVASVKSNDKQELFG